MDSHIIKYTDWALKNGLFYPKSSNNDILLTLAFEKVEDFCNGVAFVSNGNKWGCIDSKGSIIIPLEYDIIKFDEYDYKRFHILCGYEGELFKGIATSDWLRVTEEKEIYTGIYDLYNLNGNFLFGGFSEYKYDNKTNTFMFIFGRTWRLYKKQSKYSFDKNKYWYNDYKTKWLLLTKDFLCPFDSSFENNQIMISKKSFKGEKASYKKIAVRYLNGMYFPDSMFSNKDRGTTIYKNFFTNLPDVALFDSITVINDNIIRCSQKGKYCLIYLNERKITSYYDFISPIDNEYTIVYDGKLGLMRNGKMVVACEYSYITKPVDNWVFVIRRYPYIPNRNDLWKKYYAMIFNLNDGADFKYDFQLLNEVVAIEEIEMDKVESMLNKEVFLLLPTVDVETGDFCITINKKYFNLFSKEFQNLIHGQGEDAITDTSNFHYWYSIELMKLMRDGPPKYDEDKDYYSIKDALDYDPEAYWNID